MDDLEGLARSKPNEREAQFVRLRDQIEELAVIKFLAKKFEGNPPAIILRSADFQAKRATRAAEVADQGSRAQIA